MDFGNNKDNKKNLPTLTVKDVTIGDNYFKFHIDASDGIYYHDNEWQYVKIQNGHLIETHRYYNSEDDIPSLVGNNEIKDGKIYVYNTAKGKNAKLYIIPDENEAWERICEFISTLQYSGYELIGDISEDVIEFDYYVNPNFECGHKNIRLVRGLIKKYY